MPLLQDDMSQVADWGEVPPEGWYHVRVDRVTVEESQNTPGTQTVKIIHKIQQEPLVGRTITDFPSLQPHALAKLKTYYKKGGYEPGVEGHDPEKILGFEYFVQVTHDSYQGSTRAKISPWGIRSMQEGAGQ